MENQKKRSREDNCRIFLKKLKQTQQTNFEQKEYVKKDTSGMPTEFVLKKAKIQFLDKSFHLYNDKGNKAIILNGLNMKTLVEKLWQFKDMENLTQQDINAKIEKYAGLYDAEKSRGGDGLEIPLPEIPDRDVLTFSISNTGTYEFRMILNVYEADTKIWLKMIRHPEPGVDQFCKGGIRFVKEDDVTLLEKFVFDCIDHL